MIKTAELIQTCCKTISEKIANNNEENEENEEEEGEERRGRKKNKGAEDNVVEETFTFLTSKTVAGATTTLVSILEKVLI